MWLWIFFNLFEQHRTRTGLKHTWKRHRGQKVQICGFGCVIKVCSNSLCPFPGEIKSAEIFLSLEFAYSVMLKHSVESLWLWHRSSKAHACPTQSLSAIAWLPDKESCTQQQKWLYFQLHRSPQSHNFQGLRLAAFPRAKAAVPFTESLIRWSFVARWNKARILKHPVAVPEEAPSATCFLLTQQLLHQLLGTCNLV